ncbi:aldehyde dehydrogenase family protein [Lutispora saccharofermentans]|uniref:Aldehyde dehydrogenase family protein n=1 Tax=Lutispora saccharofermentans TaxID=3024236 RepID=A0ABT1NGT4_9FIRM|nr:aldehyde dehydrogenase family protein [Lutispora saccharofermentans]MCQ1530437.1 aldehyde dehydrogenase family protein [Lutispora saccharofermentans]
MDNQAIAQELVEKAKVALKQIESYTQEQVDELVYAACLTFREHADELSTEVVEETGLGNVEDKRIKNFGTADTMWQNLKGKKSVGIIDRDEENGLIYVASPKGVIISVAPTTNPNITALCNAVFAIKGRNTVVVSPHPRAKKTTKHTIDLIRETFKKMGAPEDIIQMATEPSVELTQELMKAGDVVVATGGMAMVKSAYSSGKPAFGVGAGNVQTVVDRGFDYDEACAQIVESRSFDNGLICAGNQSIIFPAEDEERIVAGLKKNNAYYMDDPVEADKFREFLFPDGKHINSKAVGQSAVKLAEMAGMAIPDGTRAIAVRGSKIGAEDALCGEKMCPVLVILPYHTFEEAVEIAKTNLLYQGAGHSAVIHTNDDAKVEYMGTHLPVSRLLVNQPGIAAAGTNPVFINGLNATTSLGCGSWGNNSISENLTYKHLINISRIAYRKPGAKPATQEEIWG